MTMSCPLELSTDLQTFMRPRRGRSHGILLSTSLEGELTGSVIVANQAQSMPYLLLREHRRLELALLQNRAVDLLEKRSL